MARIIGVLSGKGGVGKTIVAINLAASLAKAYKKKTLLVDCNITTSHVGLYLGLYSTPKTLNDVLKGKIPIEKAIYRHGSGIDVIPASLKLDDLRHVEWTRLKSKLSKVAGDYDYIILDSSPGFDRESLITLDACEEAVIVTNPIVHTVADVIRAKQASKKLGVKTHGIVLNMVRNKVYELNPREVSGMTGLDVICTIPYNEKIAHSTVLKKPAIDAESKTCREFYRLAKYVTGEELEETGVVPKLMSALNRLWFAPKNN